MQAGSNGESLRLVADRLLAEFAGAEASGSPEIRSPVGGPTRMGEALDADQEALVTRLREALVAIASTLSPDAEAPSVQTTEIALDGAEFVIRGELAGGNAGRVMSMLPSFVFLVALSVADRDRALGLSRRTAELIDQIGYEDPADR